VWMSPTGFWLYNGFVQPVPCDVSDYVFSNLNIQQMSKVSVTLNTTFSEVKWFYPSAGSTEVDSYVLWNYSENTWNIGKIVRYSGVDGGVFQHPLECASDGKIYDHEFGFLYTGASSPYLESGPIELGNGDNVMYATRLFPDILVNVGDVTATFKVKFEPDGAETSFGPYTLTQETDVRFGGRTVKVRYTGSNPDDWRVGDNKLDLMQGGLR